VADDRLRARKHGGFGDLSQQRTVERVRQVLGATIDWKTLTPNRNIAAAKLKKTAKNEGLVLIDSKPSPLVFWPSADTACHSTVYVLSPNVAVNGTTKTVLSPGSSLGEPVSISLLSCRSLSPRRT
jgi:hypothetical protein